MKHLSHGMLQIYMSAVVFLLATVVAFAKPSTMQITLKEQLNLAYGPELVSYPFSAKAGTCVADSIQLTGPRGPVAAQLSDVEYWPGKQQYVKSARLVFVADELKALATDVYTLTYDSKPAPATPSDLQIHQDKDTVEITTSHVGIRLPVGGANPVSGKDVPGALAAMRLGNGAWAGGSSLTGDVKVKSWSAELLDAGPVVARVRMVYTLADGNILTLTASVAGNDSAVRWAMSVASDHPELGIQFRLPPLPGVKQALLPRGYGQWAREHTLALTPSAKPFLGLVPNTSLGTVFFTEAVPTIRLAQEGGTELFLASSDPGAWVEPVAPLTYAGFKRWEADSIPLMWKTWQRKAIAVTYAPDGTVLLDANLANGQRKWVVSAGAPKVGDTLDRVKDLVLDWPTDAKQLHPRLFMRAPDVQAAWKRAATDPELMKQLTAREQRWAWSDLGAPAAIGVPLKPAALTTQAEKDQAVKFLREQLALLGNFDVMRGAIGMAGLYDALIDSDLLTPADKTLFRAQMARLAYVMADPQCWSIERGYLSGNPNMSSSYTCSLGIIACAISDHPLAKTWANYTTAWIDKWLTDDVGPNGEWITEGSHYGTASLEPMVAFAIAAKRAGFHDFTNDPRLKKFLLYYAKTQTPRDPRQPGNLRASGAWGRGTSGNHFPLFGMAAYMNANADPAFTQTMQWMWAAEGYPAPGADWRLGGYEAYAFDRGWPVKEPSWSTELFPNLGVFFRTAYNTPNESYLIFLSHTDSQRNFDVWTPGIGGFSQWFGRGKPLSTCFNLDTGYRVRHELLRDGVRLARNWGAPNDPKGPFGHYVNTTPQATAFQPAADYVRSNFTYTKVDDRDWFPDIVPPAFPRVTPATEPKLDWTRQVLYMKDPDPAGPAYIVVRDTTRGGQPTAWQFWTLSEKIGTPEQTQDLSAFLADKPGPKLLPARELPAGNRYTAVGQFGVDVEYFIASPAATPRHTLRYGGRDNNAVLEYQDLLHLQLPGDGAYYVAIFPHPRTETAPAFTTLADGKIIKVTGAFGTDYAFLSLEPGECKDGPASFSGTAGAIQLRGKQVTLTLSAGGEISYGKAKLTSPTAISKTFQIE